MNFAESSWLMGLWALPLVVVLLVMGVRTYRRRIALFARLRVDELIDGRLRPKYQIGKAILLGLVFVLLVLTLARPRWGFEWKELPTGGVDILVVVDLSSSMLASDISPTRLERAKREMSDLVDLLEGDRIGIVAFAGVAFVQCPLTVDYRMARLFIDQLSTELMPVQGTALGTALRIAVDSLEKASEADSQSKAIILITDGEDQTTDPLGAAKLAAEKGIKIFAIGVGSPQGAPIPEPDGGFKKDRQGNVVLSSLDEKTLLDITTATQGTYVRSTTGDFDLDHIYKQGIRGQLESREFGETRQRIWYERFQWFLLVALILLLLEFFWSDVTDRRSSRKTRASKGWLWLLLLGGMFWDADSRLHASPAIDGSKAYEAKEYDQAAKSFLEAEVNEPDQHQHSYNRSVSQFRDGNFSDAASGFAKAAQSPDKELAKKSWFNLGNSMVAQGQLQQAAQAYNQALELDPQDTRAKENLGWVQKRLEQQKQQQQQQGDSDDKDQKDSQQKESSSSQQQDSQDSSSKDQQDSSSSKDQDEKNAQQPQDGDDSDSKPTESQQQQQPDDNSSPQNSPNPSDQQEGEQQAGSKQSSQEQDGQDPQPAQQLEKQAAERLLRSLEEQDTVYGVPPKVARPDRLPEKDW